MPAPPRLFVSPALYAGAVVDATPAQARYLTTVLRRGPGDPVLLFNGRDGEWQAELRPAPRGSACCLVQSLLRSQAPEPDLWLAFALLKRDATDLVVQKATELGVSVIVPVLTARTNVERVNLDRLTAIATEAAEQSERLTVPEIRPLQRLDALLAAWPPDRPLVVAIERSAAPPVTTPAGGLLIGPEGGFTPQELDGLRRFPVVVPATLGPRILRAETAAIAGLALLQARADLRCATEPT
jgi:16S rRNA (uracil1498-N3)-methyltransferase